MVITKPAYLFLALVSTITLLLAFHPAYFPHLSTDVYIYFLRTQFFINNLSLNHLSQNEYQPGAIFFFILLSPTLLINNSFEWFRSTFFTANLLLIFLLSFIYLKFRRIENLYLYSLILLFTGPIILFRFELLVILLICLAFLLWEKNYPLLTAFTLGIATHVKVFPVIFMPYLILLTLKNSGFKKALELISAYFLGLISFLIFYVFIFNARYVDIINALNFHALKPVGLESVWATIFMLNSLVFTNTLPMAQSGNGIWGISDTSILGPSSIYNYIWAVPFALLHLWFYIKSKHSPHLKFDIRFCLINILLFLVFQKVIAPQYILWFVLLVPLLNIKLFIENRSWAYNLIIIFLITFLYQYLYPLNYGQWVEGFQGKGDITLLIFLNSLRNILLIILCFRLFFDLQKHFHTVDD